MHTVNVIQPADVFNLKFRSRNATDEALAFDLFFDFTFDGSFFSERVNDDTEENVHEDDVEQHEEEEVVDVPCIVVGVTKGCVVQGVSDTTSRSNTILGSRAQALNKCFTVHLVWVLMVDRILI